MLTVALLALAGRNNPQPAQPAVEAVTNAPPPPSPSPPPAYSNHGCICLPVWSYDDETFNGCDVNAPKSKRPWCMVEQVVVEGSKVRCGFGLSGGAEHSGLEDPHWDFCDDPSQPKAAEKAIVDRLPLRASASSRGQLGMVGAFMAAGAVAAVAVAVAAHALRPVTEESLPSV